MPGVSEWDACQRPLGVWNAIWVVREALTCLCAYWAWKRERKVRAMYANQPVSILPVKEPDISYRQERRQTADAETVIEETEYPRGRHATHTSRSNRRRRPTTQELLAQQPYTHLYNRSVLVLYSLLMTSTHILAHIRHIDAHNSLSVLTSALSLVWFLTAHILEYTSVNTCRHAAPHLWWLTFGILCILYFMILEIFLLGLLVFILGPVLFVSLRRSSPFCALTNAIADCMVCLCAAYLRYRPPLPRPPPPWPTRAPPRYRQIVQVGSRRYSACFVHPTSARRR